jgi:uncharacterized protein YjdB
MLTNLNLVLLSLYPKNPVIPTGLTLSQKTATGAVGATRQITATIELTDADDKTVTWSSSNEAVATVDLNGLITFVGVGTATITAKTSNGIEATVSVTVNQA